MDQTGVQVSTVHWMCRHRCSRKYSSPSTLFLMVWSLFCLVGADVSSSDQSISLRGTTTCPTIVEVLLKKMA